MSAILGSAGGSRLLDSLAAASSCSSCTVATHGSSEPKTVEEDVLIANFCITSSKIMIIITREMQGIVGQASDFVEVVSKID